jgi:hypothetical protein
LKENEKMNSTEAGLRMSRKINAAGYIECSSLSKVGLSAGISLTFFSFSPHSPFLFLLSSFSSPYCFIVFDSIVRVVLRHSWSSKKKKEKKEKEKKKSNSWRMLRSSLKDGSSNGSGGKKRRKVRIINS